eukprot:TRINITY_DN6123_c0_g1_i10.p1 TRINITY_DN6123_c0_g1~~TRINITY_DN6123_c0_g1_i10.p1  ORF type:complete len:658 (-),score=111.33 TRINITY_DN6123_c0_g1_i10:2295-4268(-)
MLALFITIWIGCQRVRAASLESVISDRTNYLMIMTDDQGYDDIGIHHPKKGRILHTPNMNKFAKESVEFSNFYTTPLCATSRANLFTGRNHFKTGVWGVHGSMEYINLDETMLPEVMQKFGYVTAHFGKWHNGKSPGYTPWDRGFLVSYQTHLYTFYNNRVLINGVEKVAPGWIEEWLGDRINEFIDQRSVDNKPFFAAWTPMAIHRGKMMETDPEEDFVAPPEYVERYQGLVPDDLAKVFASTEYFDYVLGKVLDHLEATGLAENTVVMFFSDNGPHIFQTDHIQSPERELRIPSKMVQEKGYVWEDGIRSFLYVRKGTQYPAGKVVDEPVELIDFLPTIMEMSGIPQLVLPKKLDGFSFAPLLTEEGTWAHSERYLFFHEILKNWLNTDQVPLLDPETRMVDKSQPLLSFLNGGARGQGFGPYSAVRWDDYKLIGGTVYDIKAGNHVESSKYNLQLNGSPFVATVMKLMQDRLRLWWQGLLMEEGSFEKPVFFIGGYDVSEYPVFLTGAIERTPGNIILNDHYASGFVEEGDKLRIRVLVQEEGDYDVEFIYRWTGPRDAVMKLSIGSHEQIEEETAPSLEVAITKDYFLSAGTITLPATAPGTIQELQLELLSIAPLAPTTKSTTTDTIDAVFLSFEKIKFQQVMLKAFKSSSG